MVPKPLMVHVNASVQYFVPLKVPVVLLQYLTGIPTTFGQDLFFLELLPYWSSSEVHPPLLSAKYIVLHALLAFYKIEVKNNQW